MLTFLMPKLLEQETEVWIISGGGSGGGVGVGAEKADGNAGGTAAISSSRIS